MQVSQDPQERPKKRRKIAEACTECRRRKTRCDGKKPVCVACEERGVGSVCVYNPIGAAPLSRPNETFQSFAKSRISTGIWGAKPSSQAVNGDRDGSRQEDTSEVLCVPSYTETDELYGPASNVSFSRSVVPHIRSSRMPNSTATATGKTLASPHSCSGSFQSSQSVLPLRKTANDLVRCYFDLIWPLFPVLHHPSFMKRYGLLWDPEQPAPPQSNAKEESLFLAITNLVFALGSQCSPSIALEERSSVADEFFQRAQKPCLMTYLDDPSLSAVQMYLLSAIYLQSLDAGRCWYFTGTAIRVAQALGFHIEPRVSTKQTRAQLKLRRCIWHTCVTFDRLTALGYGRPTMIQPGTLVSLPAAVDDHDKVDTNDFLSSDTDELGMFVYSCKLFDILHDVLQQFYPSDRPSFVTDNFERLITVTVEIIRRLDKLQEIVPPRLRADEHMPLNMDVRFSVAHLQRQVLYCRFLFVRTMALRPLLLQSVRLESSSLSKETTLPTFHSSLDGAVLRQSHEECVKASCKLVQALYANLDTPYRNSPWHTVYLVFSSATILLAAWQSRSIDTDQREQQFDQTWEQCLTILAHHAPQLSSASRALEILFAMKENILCERDENVGVSSYNHVNSTMGSTTRDEALPTVVPSITTSVDDIGDTDFQEMSEDWLDQFIADMSWLDVPQISSD